MDSIIIPDMSVDMTPPTDSSMATHDGQIHHCAPNDHSYTDVGAGIVMASSLNRQSKRPTTKDDKGSSAQEKNTDLGCGSCLMWILYLVILFLIVNYDCLFMQ